MAMSREEQDAFDRRMAGMDPMLRPEGTAGGPVRSYSFSDLRRMLGFGERPAMSPAEAADAAQMYERLPNAALPPTPPGDYDAPSPSIPYMPSTDPRGAAAPIPAPPRPAAPPRPRLPVMRGLPTNEAGFVPPRPDTFGGLSPEDMAAMAAPAPAPAPAMAQPAPAPAPAPAMPPAADPIGPPPARPLAFLRPPSPTDLAWALRESDERFARSTGSSRMSPWQR